MASDPHDGAAKGRAPSRLDRLGEVASRSLAGTRAGRFTVGCARAARLVGRGFRGEKIGLRASALTFITMLSLVPALAVAFAIVRVLGQDSLRRVVHDFIFANLAPGAREQVGAYLDEFIARASAGAWGGLGGLFLLVSAVSLLQNIEGSLNEIWGVAEARPIVQRVLIYWGVLTLGPIALGVSLLATGHLQRYAESSGLLPKSLLELVSLAATVLLLTFLYLAAPNARVRLGAALGGGLIAGVAWELAKRAYALYAAKSFQYSAIYGSLGAVPLFLLWVFVSWLLVLFGARLAYAIQYAAGRSGTLRPSEPRDREILCASVALAAVARFLRGAEPASASLIARELGVEAQAVADAADRLRVEGLLADVRSGGLVPARPPDQIHLLDISRAARGAPPQGAAAHSNDSIFRKMADLFEQADRQGQDALSKVDLASLAAQLAAAEPAGPRT